MNLTTSTLLELPLRGTRVLKLALLTLLLASPTFTSSTLATDIHFLGEVDGCAGVSLCGDFGWALASADFDGDGVSDLVVGAPTANGSADDTGEAYIFYGPLDRGRSAADADATPTAFSPAKRSSTTDRSTVTSTSPMPTRS